VGQIKDTDIGNLAPWGHVARWAIACLAWLRLPQSSLRRLLTPLMHRRLSALSQDPVSLIQIVAEAQRKERLAGLYASALQKCIRGEAWDCWADAFRLDNFGSERECEKAVHAFTARWIRDGVAPNPANERPRLDGSRKPKPSTPGLDWVELIRALYVLNFYERTDYGRSDFALIMQTVRGLFAQVRTAETEMTSEQRKSLIRYAIHFDYLEKAADLAAGGGGATAFEQRLLAEYRRCAELNSERVARLHSVRGGESSSVIGSLVWGRSFVASFLDYHVRSLLAPGNIPALAKRGHVIWSIVTTEADREALISNPVFQLLSNYVQVEVTYFDESLLDLREQAGFNFYWLYGMLDHINIDLARKAAADIFLLPTDTVVSESFLSTMSASLSAGADCCAVGYIESEKTAFLHAIDARVRNGHIALEGAALLDLAACHMTNHFRSLIMDLGNVSFCRHPRELIWPIEGGFMMHALFMHPVAISARMMSRPFHPNYENVDYALTPRVLQDDGKFVVIQDARRAAGVHFSPLERAGAYTDHGFSLSCFLAVHDHDYSIHRESFHHPVFLPCSSPGHLASNTYDDEYRIIRSALERPPIGRLPNEGGAETMR
jgi:hypothetical protein